MTTPAPEAPTLAEPTPAEGAKPNAEVDLDALRAAVSELGLTPDQIKGRLDASRKWEQRAKDNKVAADRLEQLERERMTDAEKERTAAFEGGRAAERTALTERLVAAEFKAAAALAGRDVAQVSGLLEDLNVSRFLTADGEVDTERITARVTALPVAQEPAAPRLPDMGQGRRQAAPMDAAELGRQWARERFGAPAKQ